MNHGGKPVSESTANRLLRRLDGQGLTQSLDGRGRVASDAGLALAQRAAAEEKWHQQVGHLEIRTLHDVRDLLIARRGVEREIARDAAVNIGEAGLDSIRRTMTEYAQSIELDQKRRDVATNFHKVLAETVSNSMLRTVGMVVFDPRFDTLEQVLDVVTASRGTTKHSPREHETILAAIEAGDPDAAEQGMVDHINRLIEDASALVPPSTRMAIELLLRGNPPASY